MRVPFSRRNRQIHMPRNLGQILDMFRRHRILVKKQVELLQRLSNPNRVPHSEPGRTVHVRHQVDLRTDRFPQSAYLGDRVLYASRLEAAESPFHQLLRPFRRLRVRIKPDTIPDLASQQIPDRHAQRLPFDVPQRHLNPGQRAPSHDARHAVPHHRQIHLLPDPLD